MPPKKSPVKKTVNKVNNKPDINQHTVDLSNIGLHIKGDITMNDLIGGKKSKPIKKPSKPIKIKNDSDSEEEDEEDDLSNDEDQKSKQDEEEVKDSDVEDENNIDDDVTEEEYKENNAENYMENEIDVSDDEEEEVDEEETPSKPKKVDDDDDKSVNEENLSGTLDLTDCLLDEEVYTDEIVEPTMIEPEKRMSRAKLTKYERVRILAARTKQLALGAPPLVKNIKGKSPMEIAVIELSFNMIPFKIRRPMPNNTYEIWKLSELEK